MQKPADITHHRRYTEILLGTMISCFVGFYNNYPLVFPDTGTYIYSGFVGTVFYDRTLFYGFFFRLVSLGYFPFLVIFCQALMVSYLISQAVGLFFEGLRRAIVCVSLITLLTLTTAYSYTVSILIPDIFSAVSILALINLLLNQHMRIWDRIFTSIIFVFSVCTQLSSIPIFMIFFGILFLFLFIRKIRKKNISIVLKKPLICLSLFLSCLVIIPSVHYISDKQFLISGGKHVFGVNHLVETGILEEYLDEKCASTNYRICRYKDSLGWNFIWSPTSPLQKTGGWDANREEYKTIIRDVVTTPRYLGILVVKAAEYTCKQFFSFDITVSPAQLYGTAPFAEINRWYTHSVREYVASRQNTNTLKVEFINHIQLFVVLSSMAFLLSVVVFPVFFQKLSHSLRWAVILVLLHNLINCLVCANLSTVHMRFQSRLAWMFPLLAVIVILHMVETAKGGTKGDELSKN